MTPVRCLVSWDPRREAFGDTCFEMRRRLFIVVHSQLQRCIDLTRSVSLNITYTFNQNRK
jgi:hypothetical protein